MAKSISSIIDEIASALSKIASIIGSNGKNTIVGTAGSDVLNGGNGKDVIIGKQGADVMDGGRGRDTFLYKAGDLAPTGIEQSLENWVIANQRAKGFYSVDTVFGDSDGVAGAGSLHLTTTSTNAGDTTGKIDVVNYDPTIFNSNATLGNLNDLGFDWFKGASSADNHFAPALRLSFLDAGADNTFGTADDVSGYLIWEHLYDFQNTPGNTADQNAMASEGQWFQENLMDSEFYMRVPGFGEVPVYGNTLQDWKNGAVVSAGSVGQVQLDATTKIKGIEVGLGSGWSGEFDGAVDDIHFKFGTTAYNTDFGDPATPVDTINNFVSGHDKIDLSRLLQGANRYSNVNDFVRAQVDSDGDTHLYVDVKGKAGGASFVEFAELTDATINLQCDIILV
jgi:Ca2+-binding RTX toxin-like protein